MTLGPTEEQFKLDFMSSLNLEQMSTIKYALENYLREIEGQIREQFRNDALSERNQTAHEDLTFLYHTAAQISQCLFQYKYASEKLGLDI